MYINLILLLKSHNYFKINSLLFKKVCRLENKLYVCLNK